MTGFVYTYSDGQTTDQTTDRTGDRRRGRMDMEQDNRLDLTGQTW